MRDAGDDAAGVTEDAGAVDVAGCVTATDWTAL